jgi:hypothetical protein
VRRSVRLGGERHEVVRRWSFDLDDWARAEPQGWSFGWTGEHVSSPVRYLVHTDGRFGVTSGGPFLEVNPSIYHMIESHALMDEVAEWNPVAGSALEPWVGDNISVSPFNACGDLNVVKEASGPCEQWIRSEVLAILRFRLWAADRPRPTSVMIWKREGSSDEVPRRSPRF